MTVELKGTYKQWILNDIDGDRLSATGRLSLVCFRLGIINGWLGVIDDAPNVFFVGHDD